MTKDTTIHLPPVFEQQEFKCAAAAFGTLLAPKPSPNEFSNSVATLSAAGSQAKRHIYFLEHKDDYSISPTGLTYSAEDCQEVIDTIGRAWNQYREIHKPGAKRPKEFDLRGDAVSVLIPA